MEQRINDKQSKEKDETKFKKDLKKGMTLNMADLKKLNSVKKKMYI